MTFSVCCQSKNFAAMATWLNDFSSLLPSLIRGAFSNGAIAKARMFTHACNGRSPTTIQTQAQGLWTKVLPESTKPLKCTGLACEQAFLLERASLVSPLARLLFTISPKWRACLQANTGSDCFLSPGYYNRPKRNRRQWLCQILEGKQGALNGK